MNGTIRVISRISQHWIVWYKNNINETCWGKNDIFWIHSVYLMTPRRLLGWQISGKLKFPMRLRLIHIAID